MTLIDTGISIGMSKYLHQFTQEALVAAMSRRPEALGKAMYELHQSALAGKWVGSGFVLYEMLLFPHAIQPFGEFEIN